MLQFRLSTPWARCGTAWPRASPAVAPKRTILAVPLGPSVRHVSTTRPEKAQAMTAAPTTPQTAKASRFAPSVQTASPTPALPAKATAPPTPTPTPTPSPAAKSSGKKSRADPSSPEYKKAARKLTAGMVAMPILLVTSYVLYNRLVLGNQHDPETIRRKIRGEPAKTVLTEDKLHSNVAEPQPAASGTDTT